MTYPITYVIRTCLGRDVFSYDSLLRAREDLPRLQRKIGVALKIVAVERTEREVA